jgi:Reverse transcriptase (RNA-dependent DNA polymerase)
MSLDAFRMMMSIAAERGWSLCSLDIKAAYLQTEDFNREIYVTPPREEAEDDIVWRLTAAAYGLADSGRLWYLTSSRALKAFGLNSR